MYMCAVLRSFLDNLLATFGAYVVHIIQMMRERERKRESEGGGRKGKGKERERERGVSCTL